MNMKSWHKLLIVACTAIGLGADQAAPSELITDIKSYAAAVDAGDWNRAAAAARRLLEDPVDTLHLSAAERIEMLSVAAEAAERAGQVANAIVLYQRLITETEAHDGSTSYSLVAPLSKLADLLAGQGRLDDAASAYDRVVALSEAELGIDNPALLSIYKTRRTIDRKRLATEIGNADRIKILQGRLADHDFKIETLDVIAKKRAAASADTTARTRGVNDAPFQLVTIHYGTNRKPTGRPEPEQFYSDQRGPLVLGIATVSVPKLRAIGEIPLPNMWRSDLRPNAAKHFILTKINPSASVDAFATSARAQIDKSQRREALVFIHGYNSDFQKSVFRAGQLAVDLDIDGAVFMYSWPSKGSLACYVADGAQVIRPMVRSLQEFLNIVLQKTGAERVHVVAHSMGNRYLLDALELMAREVPVNAHKPVFQQMVFAAPDVDADDFAERVKELGWIAQRMTLYASSKDRALYLSSIVNGGYRRAGDAAALVTAPGLDTVDTTEVGGEGLGHSDFADRALDDFRAIVWLSLKPQSRCVLINKKQPTGGIYWQLTGDETKTCPYNAFRSAITLLRELSPSNALEYVREKIEAAHKAKKEADAARYTAILPILDAVNR